MDPEWQRLSDVQRDRWYDVLGTVATAIPTTTAFVVGGPAEQARLFARRLSASLLAAGGIPPEVRVADGSADGDGLVVWLRTSRAENGDGEHRADVVVDLHDPGWPVIRRFPGPADRWYLRESRAFFGASSPWPPAWATARRRSRWRWSAWRGHSPRWR